MTTLSDISKAANTRMVLAQIHWAEFKDGAGAASGFNIDIDKIVAQHKVKMDNLHALDSTVVTSAKSALDTLAASVKTAGPVVPNAA